MRISATIMAHPERSMQAEYLAAILRYYPFVNVSVVYDEKNDEWDTGRRSLESGIGLGDWHVVIQDDALLTPYFYDNLVGSLSMVPSISLVSLYTGTARPLSERVAAAMSKAKDGTFLQFQQLMWGVGIAVPTGHIQPMLDFVEDVQLQYDNKVGEFYCRNGLSVYYTVPSLVDHDDTLESLIEGHGRDVNQDARVAHRLATDIVGWNQSVINI